MGRLLAAYLALQLTGFAISPPAPKSLPERVRLATHIVSGTARHVMVCEEKGGKLVEVKPEPKSLSEPGMVLVIDIEPAEVLTPAGWEPPKTIQLLFGGGYFDVEAIRTQVIGEKLLYLMKSWEPVATAAAGERSKPTTIFVPSYAWSLREPLTEKRAVEAALEAQGRHK